MGQINELIYYNAGLPMFFNIAHEKPNVENTGMPGYEASLCHDTYRVSGMHHSICMTCFTEGVHYLDT